jgi:hypothetical protein
VTARGRVGRAALVWKVRYSPHAKADFRGMSLGVAESICGEVHAAANARPAHIQSDPNDPSFITIFAEGGFATVRVDARNRTFNVSRLVADGATDPGEALLDDPEPPPSSR